MKSVQSKQQKPNKKNIVHTQSHTCNWKRNIEWCAIVVIKVCRPLLHTVQIFDLLNKRKYMHFNYINIHFVYCFERFQWLHKSGERPHTKKISPESMQYYAVSRASVIHFIRMLENGFRSSESELNVTMSANAFAEIHSNGTGFFRRFLFWYRNCLRSKNKPSIKTL